MTMNIRGALAASTFALITAGLAFTARTTADAQQAATQPADLVITNGKVVTVETGVPDAQAVASRGGRIVAIGSAADMKAHIGPNTEVIDVKGQLVLPGFIEGHGHFTGVGSAQLNLNLMNTTSWDQIVAMVAEKVKTAKPGRYRGGAAIRRQIRDRLGEQLEEA